MNKPALTILIVFFGLPLISAQDNIRQKVAQYTYLTHPEKLYMATDRNVYRCGDTIRYSSWLLDAGKLSAEKMEKILEVRLVDSRKGKGVAMQIVPIENGRSKGQMTVPAGLESGAYRLTGNTNYMRNRGEDFFFGKTVYIRSNFSSVEAPKVATEERTPKEAMSATTGKSVLTGDALPNEKSDLNIVFLPEGGNWMAGVPSRVAFYGTLPGTDSVDFSGTVYDSDNNAVAFIKPEFRGRGSVNITPAQGQRYHANITDSYGVSFNVDLPLPEQNGRYTLSVNSRWNSPKLNVNVYKSPFYNNADPIKLVVVQHGAVVCRHGFLPGQNINVLGIDKADLKTGIARLTLFDQHDTPLCERLVFVNNGDFTQWEPQVETSNGHTRITVSSKDKSGQALTGDYAVSVFRVENGLDTLLKPPGIVQYLYLNADLPGLETDCSYFFKEDAKSFYCADLAMLTNGWRRYKWDEVLADSVPAPEYPLEQKFYISGTVRRQGNGKPVKEGIELTLMGNGEDVIVGTAKTNDKGEFYFPIDDFNNSSEFVIQTRNKLNFKADYKIELKTNLVNHSDVHDYASKIAVAQKYVEAGPPKHRAPVELKPVAGDLPVQVAAAPLPEPSFEDTTDVKISEVTIKEKRILSPEEKIYEKYGPPSLVVSAPQIAKIDHDNKWNFGFVSLMERMIPGLRCMIRRTKTTPSLYMTKVCVCQSLDIELKDWTERYELAYKGQCHFRFYIYVDGELCAFTNHGGQVDWAKDNLLSMDVLEIENINFIEHPQNDAILDAMSVSKQVHEFYCSSGMAGHIINGCPVGFQPAPARIISIKTKSGFGLYSSSNNNGIASTRLSGYTRAREFYVPKYNTDSITDFMQSKTIYWNPTFRTGDKGAIFLDVDLADPTSGYMLAINGMNKHNEPGSYFRMLKNNIVNKTKVTGSLPQRHKEVLPEDEDGLIKIVTENNTPCNFATVWSKSGKLKQQTALEGKIKVDLGSLPPNDSIFVSVPNYGNAALQVKDLETGNYIVRVPYQVSQEQGVAFKKSLVAEVNKHNVKNLSLTPYHIQGVFREQLFTNGYLVSLTDAGFVQRKAAYKDRVHPYSTMITEARQYRPKYYKKEVPFELNHRQSDFVPNLDAQNIDLSFLDKKQETGYTYTYVGRQQFNGRSTSVYSFVPKADEIMAMYSGIILVDDRTRALVHVQWQVYEARKRLVTYNTVMAPKRKEPAFKLINDRHHVTYCLQGDKWKLLSASRQYQWLYNGKPYRLRSELIITDWLINGIPKFKKTAPYAEGQVKVNDSVDYAPSIWRQKDVLVPYQLLKEQVKTLQEETIWK